MLKFFTIFSQLLDILVVGLCTTTVGNVMSYLSIFQFFLDHRCKQELKQYINGQNNNMLKASKTFLRLHLIKSGTQKIDHDEEINSTII